MNNLQNVLCEESIEEFTNDDYEENMVCVKCQFSSCEDINCPFKQSSTN
jgi:hypothetical protein